MKIAHLVTAFSAEPGSGDGPGDELVDLVAASPATGVEPVVIVLGSAGDRWAVARLRRLRVPVVELGLAPGDPRAYLLAVTLHDHLAGTDPPDLLHAEEAALRLSRCLLNDPAMGVVRHADAGYEKAQRVARERGCALVRL